MSRRVGDPRAVVDDDRREPDRALKGRKQARIQPRNATDSGANETLGERRHLPPKLQGELGELDFLRKAMGMGMLVSKPWGDSYRYDFVVDWEGNLSRTQVRSTQYCNWRCYGVHACVYGRGRPVPLTAKDIDVLVAYISTRNIWYVLPVKAFSPRTALSFYPDGTRKGGTFEKYREAWWVMMGKKMERKLE